jgi:hypothetical protein
MPGTGLRDHPRGDVDSGDGRAVGREVGGHLARSRADVDDGALRLGRDPPEQPGVERLGAELAVVALRVRVGHDVVGAPYGSVPRLGAVRQRGLAVHDRLRERLAGRQGPEQVHPSAVLLAWTLRQLAHQRGLALGHRPQRPLDGGPVGEHVQPLGPGAQLSGRLRPAQQQHGEEPALFGVEVDHLVERLGVLHGA